MSEGCEHRLVGAEVVNYCGDCGDHLVGDQWLPSPGAQIASLTSKLSQIQEAVDTLVATVDFERGRSTRYEWKLKQIQRSSQQLLASADQYVASALLAAFEKNDTKPALRDLVATIKGLVELTGEPEEETLGNG